MAGYVEPARGYFFLLHSARADKDTNDVCQYWI